MRTARARGTDRAAVASGGLLGRSPGHLWAAEGGCAEATSARRGSRASPGSTAMRFEIRRPPTPVGWLRRLLRTTSGRLSSGDRDACLDEEEVPSEPRLGSAAWREKWTRFLRFAEGSGDTEDPCALQRVGEDLQPTDLLVATVAPDVDHRHALGPLALGQIGVPEDDDRVALLDELVGAELELVPRANRLLEDLDR